MKYLIAVFLSGENNIQQEILIVSKETNIIIRFEDDTESKHPRVKAKIRIYS